MMLILMRLAGITGTSARHPIAYMPAGILKSMGLSIAYICIERYVTAHPVTRYIIVIVILLTIPGQIWRFVRNKKT